MGCNESAGWRARQYCDRRHVLNDNHRPSTFWAEPHGRNRVGVGSMCGSGGLRSGSEGLEAKPQECGAPAIGKEAVVSDANEAPRKQVEEKTAQELIHGKSHPSFFIAVRRISPTESDVTLSQGNQAMVGDSHPMGIAAKVLQNMFRAAKGSFAVNDPIVAVMLPDKGVESLRVGKMLELTMESDLALCESALQSSRESASKDAAEHLDRKKERVARMNPVLVIEG